MGPACEANERGTREKNDCNEMVEDCDKLPELELTDRVEVDDQTIPFAEEYWDCPEQTKIDKGLQHYLPFTMETRHGKKRK